MVQGFIAELLLDKYEIPPAARPGSFLAKYEAGLFSELKERKDFDRDLLALYEAGAIKCHNAWFVERLQLRRAAQFDMECKAANAVLSRFDEHPHGLRIEPYCTAPILSSS
ncbi:hypothetical protein BDV33DRAFT_186135, partial [Aspergillus novoparasiticus]